MNDFLLLTHSSTPVLQCSQPWRCIFTTIKPMFIRSHLTRLTTSSSRQRSTSFSTMTKLTDYPMTLTERPPIRNLSPPGVCQFTPTWSEVPLLDRIPCGTGGTSFILRFGLPDTTKPMGLTTCACLLAAAELENKGNGETMDVIRPYTPISTNNEVGCFDLLVKDYGENGWLSSYMCQVSKFCTMLVINIYFALY